jgi:hypothetical protein
MDLPCPLTTAVFHSQSDTLGVAHALRFKSYRAIDRRLLRLEDDLRRRAGGRTKASRRQLSALRWQLVALLLHEAVQLPSRWIDARLIGPSRQGPGARLTPGRPAYEFRVWSTTGEIPTVLAETLVLSSLRLGVAWFEPDRVIRALHALLRTHFAELLKRRPGQHWRSRRRPEGWPLVTRYVILAFTNTCGHSIRPGATAKASGRSRRPATIPRLCSRTLPTFSATSGPTSLEILLRETCSPRFRTI